MAEYNINFSTNASQIAKELSKVQTELAKAVQMAKPSGLKIKLSLDTADFTRAISSSFQELDQLISQVEKKLRNAKIGSPEFKLAAEQSGQLRGESQRGQMMAGAISSRESAKAFDVGSLARYERALESLRIQASLIAPNTQEWVNFQRSIGEITLELKQADKAAESIQLTQQLGALQPGSLSRLEKQLTILKNRAREIAPNTIEWKKLNKEIQNVETSIAKVSKKPMTMGQRAGAAGGAFLYGGGLGGGAGSALGGIAGGLAGGVPGAFTGAALGQLADNIGQALGATASYTAEIDKQRIALRNVTKDVTEYKNALAFIDRTSRDLAIPQDVLNKQFTQLSASVIGAGGDINLAQEAFIGIAAGIRGTGGSLADMEGALRATAQVFSKGKVSAEELRQQIGERLPGAFTLFAKSMGKTPQELDKMLEQGQVTLNDFMGFVRTLSSEYGASASEIAASSQAAGDRLATTMSRMREAVGRELQPLGAQFQEILANAVTDNEGNLVALAKAFSQAAQAIGSFIEKYGGLIASLGSTVLLFAGTTMAVKAIAVAFASIGPAIATASLAVAQYGGVMATLKLAIAGLGGPITLVVAGLALLAKGVYDTNEIFRNFVDNIGGILASDFKNAVEGMAEDAGSSANSIQTAYEDLAEKLKPIGSAIEQFFEDVFGSISDDGKSSASNVDNAFTTAFDNILSQGAAAFSGLSALIGNWWSSLPAPIRNILGGNTASILVGAGAYAAALPGRTADGKPERQGPYVPERLQKAPLAGTKPGTFPGGGGSGSGGSGSGKKAKKAKELEDYIRQEQDFLRQLAQIGQNRLQTTMGLSNEELSILKAQSEFRANNAINEQQYLEDQRNAAKYSVETRDQYLKDIKEKYDNEKTLIQQQFDQSAYAPFLALERQLIGENEELAASLDALRQGRLELTAEERIGLQVSKELRARESAGLAITPAIIQSIKDKAKAQDAYNQSLSYGKTILALQNQLALAQILDPRAERRAQIRQENPGLSDMQVENQAALEEQVAAAAQSRDQLRSIASSIGDAFGTAFKGIITGTSSVREALAGLFQSIADSFADMVAKMIAEWLKAQLIKGFANLFGSIFGGGGGDPGGKAVGTGQGIFTAANGGIATGGFRAFANGGVVSGPTMGLVGEGRYNEAIVPLPDGKSIPVQLAGGDGGNQIISNITVNVNNGQAQSNATGSNSSEMGRKIEGAVKQVIVGELRPGGLLASKK
jgi:tape measure domain-containing protein